jgi:hypothetical protein
MSERKTSEIKFRIEPSVKARWQDTATEETDGNLSELITKALDQYVRWAATNRHLEGDTGDRITMLDPGESKFQTLLAPKFGEPHSWMFEGRDA